jgi:hypothetical protein
MVRMGGLGDLADFAVRLGLLGCRDLVVRLGLLGCRGLVVRLELLVLLVWGCRGLVVRLELLVLLGLLVSVVVTLWTWMGVMVREVEVGAEASCLLRI